MNKSKTIKRVISFTIAILLGMSIGYWISADRLTGPYKVHAATTAVYQEVDVYGSQYESSYTQSIGESYFKAKDGTLYVGKSAKKCNQKVADSCYDPISNGKIVVYSKTDYIEGNSVTKLYEYNIKTKKTNHIETFVDYYSLGAVDGNNYYLNFQDEEKGKILVYVYNSKSHKLKKYASGVNIDSQYGKTVVGKEDLVTDVSPYQTSLYKITSKKLKKVKELGYTIAPAFADGKLYYAKYDSAAAKKITLLETSLKGKKLDTIKTFSLKKGGLIVHYINDKFCVGTGLNGKFNGSQIYTYKTDKITIIKD